MELVLPNNYVEIEEEEMMYLDGGWSTTMLIKNLSGAGKALSNRFSGAGRILKQIGFYDVLKCAAYQNIPTITFKVARLVTTLSWKLKPLGIYGVIGILTTLSLGAAVLANYRIFY